MTIDFLTELDIDFEEELQIVATEFVSLDIVESCFALPIMELKVNFIDPDRYEKFEKSKYFDVTLTFKEVGNTSDPIKFRALILGKVSPSITQHKNYSVRAMFFLKEFNQDRVTETYLNKSPNEILSIVPKDIKVVADTFSKTDTFYQFNTNHWDFILNYLMPFVQTDSSGFPLMGLALKPKNNELILTDTANNSVPKYRVSSHGGSGIYEYEDLSMDTVFNEQSFRFGRMHSLVKSSYTEAEIIPFLSPYVQITDMPLMFDNGNCAENHTVKPIEHTSLFVTTPTYKLHFGNSLNPIRLLDRIDVTTSEDMLSGVYFITKVVTKLSTKVNRTFFMKGF
jgi:hypothetical protein